jgi:ATP-dependent Zn protease
MGGRSAEELVFHEPTTGASSDIDQATEDRPGDGHRVRHERQARRRALRPRAGRPVPRPVDGQPADYSLEVAHEIDEEVRKLIEAAHTEAWEILNTYRDVLDDLVYELLQKETLTRVDLERIFGRVEKRRGSPPSTTSVSGRRRTSRRSRRRPSWPASAASLAAGRPSPRASPLPSARTRAEATA